MPVADVFRDRCLVKGAFEVIQRHEEHAIVCVDPASSLLGGLVPLVAVIAPGSLVGLRGPWVAHLDQLLS